MLNIKSAKKRMRTSEVERVANHATTSRLSLTRRKLLESIAGGDQTASQELFRTYCSRLDKAVKTGVVKANSANRRKSRIAAKLAAL